MSAMCGKWSLLLLFAFVQIAAAFIRECNDEPIAFGNSPPKSVQAAIELNARVCGPNTLELRWVPRPHREAPGVYRVYKRALDDLVGDPIAQLPANATQWRDTNVTSVPHEYLVLFTTTPSSARTFSKEQGYLRGAIGAEAPRARGGVLLVLPKSLADALRINSREQGNLQLLHDVWRADGWRIRTIEVADEENTVPQVKEQIKAVYNANKFLKHVFLLGRVAYPYSGNVVPDGHTNNHRGAWPTDAYYGDIEVGENAWKDVRNHTSSVTCCGGRFRNVAGDGKFDDSYVTGDLEMSVGRADFSRLTKFSLSEVNLTARYIHKMAAFRFVENKNHTYARRSFLRSGFDRLASGKTSIRFMRTIIGEFIEVGSNQILNRLKEPEGSLLSSGDGPGSYQSCSGVGTSDNLIASNPRSIAFSLFGSYFADTDNANNLMRTLIGTEHTLVTWWHERPGIYVHGVAMGGTFGDSWRRSTSRSPTCCGVQGKLDNATFPIYSTNGGGTWNTLLGDPTVRMFVVPPPRNLALKYECEEVVLSWSGSCCGDGLEGNDVTFENRHDMRVVLYEVFHVTDEEDDNWRLIGTVDANLMTGNNSIIAECGQTYQLIDTAPRVAGDVLTGQYFVRAIRLELTPSGTYYNPSSSMFAPLNVQQSEDRSACPTTTTTTTTTTTATTSSATTVGGGVVAGGTTGAANATAPGETNAATDVSGAVSLSQAHIYTVLASVLFATLE